MTDLQWKDLNEIIVETDSKGFAQEDWESFFLLFRSSSHACNLDEVLKFFKNYFEPAFSKYFIKIASVLTI